MSAFISLYENENLAWAVKTWVFLVSPLNVGFQNVNHLE